MSSPEIGNNEHEEPLFIWKPDYSDIPRWSKETQFYLDLAVRNLGRFNMSGSDFINVPEVAARIKLGQEREARGRNKWYRPLSSEGLLGVIQAIPDSPAPVIAQIIDTHIQANLSTQLQKAA